MLRSNPSRESLSVWLSSFSKKGLRSFSAARPTCLHTTLNQPLGRCYTVNKRWTSILLYDVNHDNVETIEEQRNFGLTIWTRACQCLCICRCFRRRGTKSKSSFVHPPCHDWSTVRPKNGLRWIVRLSVFEAPNKLLFS